MTPDRRLAAAILSVAMGMAVVGVFLAGQFGGHDTAVAATDAAPPGKTAAKSGITRPMPGWSDADEYAPHNSVPVSGLLAAPSGTAGAMDAGRRAEIEAQIAKSGKEPPEWWNSVKLTVPASLDLTGTSAASRANPTRELARYFHFNLDQNPDRHKEGCKLVHQILTVNKDNPPVKTWALQKLGQYYGQLLQDYPRGVYWYRKAAEAGPLRTLDVAILASCYGKLGYKEMALAELDKAGQLNSQAIRVLAEIGEVDKALGLARQLAAQFPEEGNLLAGDLCRFSGRYDEAIKYYQQCISGTGKNYRYRDRAKTSLDAVRAMQQINLAKTPDGTYRGDGIGFRGPMTVEVTVKAGRIEKVEIVSSREDWPLNIEWAMPAQAIEKQSVKGIDNVSSATFTAEAVLNAAGKALGSGARK
jgi:uncharacterized protein with FMN-binding domain